MKKYIIVPFLALTLVSPVFVHGEEEAGINVRLDIRAAAEAKKAELKARIDALNIQMKSERKDLNTEVKEREEQMKTSFEAKRAEIKDLRTEMKEEARGGAYVGFGKSVGNVVNMLNRSAAQLENIILRIGTRIAKIEAAGGNTAEVSASIELAKADIADAKLHIGIMSSLGFSSTTATTTLRANFETAKTEAREARESLKNAKDDLREALSLMKKLEKTVKIEKDLDDEPEDEDKDEDSNDDN